MPTRSKAVVFRGDGVSVQVEDILWSTRPRDGFPRLVSQYQAGKLKQDAGITQRERIEEAPPAFEDLARGLRAAMRAG